MQVLPLLVPYRLSLGRRGRLGRVAVSPLLPYKEIMLFAPHHSGKGLSLNVAEIVRHGEWTDPEVELISLLLLLLDDVIKLLFIKVRLVSSGEAESNNW